jgi:hypothetical protein
MASASPPPSPSETERRQRRRAFWIAYATCALFVALVTTVNALTTRDDQPGIESWKPWVWEYTSALVTFALIPVVPLLLRLAPPAPGRWLRFFAVHVPASLAYSLIHSGSYTLLRMAIYGALGRRYDDYRPFYEYRKDLVAYLLFAMVFWLSGLVAELRQRAQAAPRAEPGMAPTFDIRDGAKVLRVPVSDIVAVNSAGNYVEFALADGRKPLMRATLGSVEEALKAHGFVRTHRSWLVNPLRVRAIAPEGSGDFTLELEGGAAAPLSRRFPQALERLRAAP